MCVIGSKKRSGHSEILAVRHSYQLKIGRVGGNLSNFLRILGKPQNTGVRSDRKNPVFGLINEIIFLHF